MIIKNNIIPFRGYKIINLFGILFTRESELSSIDINHERIHTALMKELLYIGFYILYFFEWLFLLINKPTAKLAYRAISFEKEAYENEDDFEYLKNRKCYALWR